MKETNPIYLGDDTNSMANASNPIIDPRTNKIVVRPQIDWTKSGSKKELWLLKDFPFSSQLSAKEHLDGVRALKCLTKSDPTDEERSAVERYKSMANVLAKERQAFHKFVSEYIRSCSSQRYGQLKEELVDIGRWILENNSFTPGDSYQIQTAIPIVNGADPSGDGEKLALTLVTSMKEVGLIPRIKFPSTKPCEVKLKVDPERVKRLNTPDREMVDSHKEFISNIGNQFGGLFFPLETIQTLLSPNTDKPWIIPFRVNSPNEATGKPFINFEATITKTKLVSDRYLESVGSKASLLAMLTKCTKRPYSCDKGQYLSSSKRQHVDDDHIESDDDENNLVIDTEENDIVPIKTVPEPKKESTYSLSEFKTYLSNYEQTDADYLSNLTTSQYRISSGSSVEDEMILTVTSRCDGVWRLNKMTCADEFVMLSVKIEYMVELGAQKMALEELVNEWSALKFSSKAKYICRVRIDSRTLLLMATEYVSCCEIEADLQRLYNVDPDNLLVNLMNTLRVVAYFPQGQYILNHDSKTSRIAVYMKTDLGKGWHDLMHAQKTILPDDLLDVPYNLPIDDQIVTHLHKIQSVLPGCVPPQTNSYKRRIPRHDGAMMAQRYQNHRQKLTNDRKTAQQKFKNRSKKMRQIRQKKKKD